MEWRMKTMENDEVLLVSIAKIANAKRPVIAVPSKIAKELDLEDIYVKFILKKDRTLILEQCNSSGEAIITEPNEFEKKVLQIQSDMKNELLESQRDIKKEVLESQRDIKNNLLETNRIIDEKLLELNQTLSKTNVIEEPQMEKELKTPKIPEHLKKEEKKGKKEIELISIKDKDPADYKYIFRYTEQDLTYEPQLVEILLGKEKLELARDETISRYGFNLTVLYGKPAIKLDSNCDWECDYKGKDRVPIHSYFNPHLETFIKNNEGVELRVPYKDVEAYEYKALYEFITITGKKYQLDNKEMWLDSYHFDADGRSIEELLSKKLYKEFLKGKYTKRLTYTRE